MGSSKRPPWVSLTTDFLQTHTECERQGGRDRERLREREKEREKEKRREMQ